jgi:hypothetical protein
LKNEPDFEFYQKTNYLKDKWELLCRFRASNFRLTFETGWLLNIPKIYI